MSGQNCEQTEKAIQENLNLQDNQCEIQDHQALIQKDEQKSLDQIEKDHNVIAEGVNKEDDSLSNINIDLDYQKYLSNEEKRTLEKLQDNTQIIIGKYKDVKQQSSQKKNSDTFMKGYDMNSPTSMESSQQAQSCITFYQYKTGKQKKNNKMFDSVNSYQSDKCNGFTSKKLDQSEQLTPKNYSQKQSNNGKQIQGNVSHQQLQNYFEAVQQNVSKRISFNSLQEVQQKQVNSLIQPQSSDEKQIAYVNRREELSPKNLLKEPYFYSSGFSFEKFKSRNNPQQFYTSFKFKSDKSSSPQSKRSRSKKQSQDEILDHNSDQQTKTDQKQSVSKLQNKQQCQNSSLLNSMLQSNSVKHSLENLKSSIQNPIQLSPNQNKKIKQANKSYKENEIQLEYNQNLQNQSKKTLNSSSKQNKHSNNYLKSQQSSTKKVSQIKESQQNQYRQSLITPSCFYFLDETSNSSILKNTLIQWFENEKIKFQNKVDSLLMNQNCYDQENSKKNNYVVSNQELDFMQNFLIDFEILLTQSNGIVNSKLETKLQEFLNNEAQIVVNRIKDKKPSTTLHKNEINSKNKQDQTLNNSLSENNLKDQYKKDQLKGLSSQAEACFKLTNIDQTIFKKLSNDEQIFNYSFHYQILLELVNQINIKTLNEQKFTKESNLKTSLFLAFFSFLANFFEFIPVVNQKLEDKTWEFCNNLLTKSGIIFNSVQKLPNLIEKQTYNPYLIQEFEESFQEVENIVCQEDKLLDDIEYGFFLKFIYSIKSLFEILKNNNIINFDQKKLQLNQKKTQEYLQKREQKIKDGIQINSYLQKSVLEQENLIQQQYGINFQEWSNQILQVQKDINTLKAKEKQHKWLEERQIKKKALEKEQQRDLDDFYRYKQFGQQQQQINRVSNLKNRESKRERINNSTEIRMIEKSQQKQRNKSMISEEIEKTKSEISFKQVLKKQAIDKKKQEHIEFVENVKEKRKVREQQIEELKKAEKEEYVWKRAQQLLEKQSKLLYEREQLLQNQRFF
ncbi:hypothetical protein TTHERM_00471310 (macronuclear) [Tetrahymena thermophila SB210]|uniref:Uncharacterized protein n=1 Tax=Tetrahymena thermophila (strain SB210) TaxID=312017 RepID=I7MGN5_TETTS|nr:hypothetical protein TTHERM_00471310 [Tetrahymena thermophila SB210]EAR85355.2 hypothetical protein TTHERM_00471310 [Tetrahymena thermophila SB210]|eukprot:XP_001033018.2 hypothetical protein TTHERM_00471310 [Tetrahymena thermophila SB210]